MKEAVSTVRRGIFSWRILAIFLLTVFGWCGSALAFTVKVVDENGQTISSGFRWLLEEDTTTLTTPGALVHDSITNVVHNSYAPVVQEGNSGTSSANVNVPSDKPYFISVMPHYFQYSISGTMVPAGTDSVTVIVNSQPIPTAQISLLAFVDHSPINNAPDVPGEAGLEGAKVVVSDLGGQIMLDAFGNPLGTTYQQDPATGAFLFDGDGAPLVDVMGNGVILTDANGEAMIKYLPPGKFGVQVIPPQVDADGNPVNWVQTATIEGTPTIDAWVAANEPKLFIEGFGTGFKHVSFGFVNPDILPWAQNPPGGSGSISGTNVYNHFARPPLNQQYFAGAPVPECWIGLNDPVTQTGLYAAPCDGNSHFSISGIPPGTYELVTWDVPLDALFGFNTVVVPEDQPAVDLGNVLSFRWFASQEGYVFYDENENGIRDPGEQGIANQAVILRFRNGTEYQAINTDPMGEYALTEIFPFFKWLVTEVDFARYKATGMTAVADWGGDPVGWNGRGIGKIAPQVQADGALSRTETGEVLTQAVHSFLSQTNIIDWGKAAYGPHENGGISGIVFYAVTRAEDDPRYAAAEPWEPGVPRVQLALYRDVNHDKIIDDLNGDGVPTLADIDNYPFGNFPGPEDIDRNGNGTFDAGDAIQVTTTDSWDDSKPTDCIGDADGRWPVTIHGQTIDSCADAYGTWNQVRPGVFDGGFAFNSYFPGGIDSGSVETSPLPAGMYIVEAATPPGYKLVKEEDKNVDFGDTYTPSMELLPPECVGDLHTVPELLSFQTDENGNPLPGLIPIAGFDALIEAPYRGQQRPLCDRKQVFLNNGQNAAAEFYLFTDVPKAARVVGFTNNDLMAEFDPTSPVFGEKATPSWIPVSFRDWSGNELLRVYADEFGSYNALLPSTFTMNLPIPSGVAPNMLTAVLNDPVMPDGSMDPWYDPNYSVTPWTFNYTPGQITYLDTPLVPVAAFAGFPRGGVDGNPASGVPVIDTVSGNLAGGGPIICTDINANRSITITSPGTVTVTNPDYDFNDPTSTPTIERDFGFGTTTGTVTLNGAAVTIDSWSNTSITATVPALLTSGTLMVTRGDNGASTEIGVTLTIASCGTSVITVDDDRVQNPAADYALIQDAIDAATPGDTILVSPGTYAEMVIMYKPVKLQGAGANSTVILGNPSPVTKLTAWHNKITTIIGNDPFRANEGPGIMVTGRPASATAGDQRLNFSGFETRIDGFTVMGALAGGGIDVNNDAPGLVISNNTITNNQGNYAGGITLGVPDLADPANTVDIVIRGNRIVKNGGIQGPGGIGIYFGSDNYLIEGNLIKGNFSRASGGGIGHMGLSDGGLIAYNDIIFNEVYQGLNLQGAGDGGGVFVGGEQNSGAGNVTVNGNLLQGNLAGAGRGGGIRALAVNAEDVLNNPADQTAWYALNVFNNMIVNNGAGHSGGGISLTDTVRANIINNTVAHNDTSGTAALAFAAGADVSTLYPAGIAASVNSAQLQGVIGAGSFSDPTLINNIVVENRSFYFDRTLNGGVGGLLPDSATPVFWDLGVMGAPGQFSPQYTLLTSLTGNSGENYGGNGNLAYDSGQLLFVTSYFNTLAAAAVIDEGGNNITIKFSELDVTLGNYHVQQASQGLNQGSYDLISGIPELLLDFDFEPRPAGLTTDLGADQLSTTSTFTAGQIGVFRSGTWYLDANGSGAWDAGDLLRRFGGVAGDVAVFGDWNADGVTEIGVFRSGDWYLDTNGNGVWDVGVDKRYRFGIAGDIPVVGDWNGDGVAQIGVYRNGDWYLDTSGNGIWDVGVDTRYRFGIAGDIPAVGDWNGDGVAQIGVFRSGDWYLDASGNGNWDAGVDTRYRFGIAGDIPVVGLWQ